MKLRYLLFFFLASTFVSGGNFHKPSSVLATGSWYKISVTKTGIHKITYDDLVAMGIDAAHIDPGTIRVFGNGGGMLPESNASFRFDDLRENAIMVVDGGDGKMDPGDFVLFYGESPDKWRYDYNTHHYLHSKNLYSDSTYYFINAGLAQGKRVTPLNSTDSAANSYSTRFDDYAFHEVDSLNLIKSGRVWYGEVFNNKKSSYMFPFHFPNLDSLSGIRIVTNVAARCPVLSYFSLWYRGIKIDSVQLDVTELQSTSLFARPKQKNTTYLHPSDNFDLTLLYRLPDSNSVGWLDYLELNCTRKLRWVGPQMAFRDNNTISPANITEFIMDKADPAVKVWEITDPQNIREVQATNVDSTLRFRLKTDTLREFIGHDGSFYYPITIVAPVANQNLHALQPKDIVIITHPLFADQADSLAQFHETHNHLSTLVVKTSDIFNEFGSGKPDITAIRDFMKMLYDKSTTDTLPKYLLLFGDGSYDPKNRVPGNNNMISTYQSGESLKFIGTYVTDDYYGILGDKAGDGSNGNIDVGIGRFPVSKREDGSLMLKKIFHYSSLSDSVLGDWRNVITFVADDENKNLHLHQAEQVASIVKNKYPVFNVNKIYNDAYRFVSTPTGDRSPETNAAITKAVTKGTLILNYTGHGGEGGWAAEKICVPQDISSWNNWDMLPVFITATCEFSRFDNPEQLTAGEMVLLQSHGGAIALYSTTRLALATSNFRLDSSFFENMLPPDGQPIPRMGDLIRISKNNNSNNNNIRNFALLGDPAQMIAYPQYRVVTSEINNKPVSASPDTLLGLSTVDVKGYIADLQGNKLTGFNGELYPKIYDKPVVYRTLGNTSDSYPENFESQNSLLTESRTTISDGDFNFRFIVPKSVALNLGKGKISYYARNSETDACGYFSNFQIGGQDPSVNPVNQGPDLSLFMQDENFLSGDRVPSNSTMLAFLHDTDGINCTGSGIGHDILGILDKDDAHAIVMNDFFTPDLDNYGSGTIRYPFNNLTNGLHTLRLKVFDLYNNSSEKEIYFFVSEAPALAVRQVINRPNPFTDVTWFEFTKMSNDAALSILIRVYDLTGKLVRTIDIPNLNMGESGFGTSIQWDGRGDNGQRLLGGLYPYTVLLTSENGALFKTSQKLVILR